VIRDTTTLTVSSFPVEHKDKLGQRSMVLGLLAVVIVSDQAIKWWAWRHVSGTLINYGGDALVGDTVSGWYAGPVTGALLDLLDVGLLSIAVSALVRRRRPAMVVIPATLTVGGWSSNLLDRLGMHYWTAPGSVRGAVDFIPIGPYYRYNIADFFIIAGTLLFLLAVSASYLRRRVSKRPAATQSVTPTTQRWPRARTRMSALACAVGIVVVVGIGAANYGGVTEPVTSASPSAQD
jgi:lipoprotein signal peptidase